MDALELAAVILNGLLLSAILYQQIARSETENRVVSLSIARLVVCAVALALVYVSLQGVVDVIHGGAS